MIRSVLFTAVSVSLCIGMPSLGHAASKEDQKLVRLLAECAYAVRTAEGNGVRLNNTSAMWDQALAGAGVKFEIDTARAQTEARLKFQKRERVMGSGEALRRVIDVARDCDANA
jgi:hypothetical protein